MQMFQTGPNRYPSKSTDAYATINQRTLAFFVGLVAIGLPLFLWLGAHNPILETCFRDSISHFYYAPFWGGPFIGSLIFIGTYMWVYQGEDAHAAEGRLASIAGVFAFGVALFPTSGHGCDDPAFAARALVSFGSDPEFLDLIKAKALDGRPDIAPYFQLTSYSAHIHYLSATLLFSFLAWFALVVFTAVDPHQRHADGTLTRDKIMRNTLYYVCGAVMILCIVAMALSAALRAWSGINMDWWNAGNWTFWCEAFALWAFGLSWMVKGRFWDTLLKDEKERV
mgnify:CR=1 FL=1